MYVTHMLLQVKIKILVVIAANVDVKVAVKILGKLSINDRNSVLSGVKTSSLQVRSVSSVVAHTKPLKAAKLLQRHAYGVSGLSHWSAPLQYTILDAVTGGWYWQPAHCINMQST